jgi:hypothetical protein
LQTLTEKCQITYKGKSIRIIADFSTEILKARRARKNVLDPMEENNYQLKLSQPGKTAIITEGEIQNLP